MPGVAQDDPSIGIQPRRRGPQVEGQPGRGVIEVELPQETVGYGYGLRLLVYMIRQRQQHAFDLAGFLDDQFAKPVVELHDAHGFDENRGAAGGLIVDHALHLAAVIHAYGDHVPPVPHGDDRVLQRPGAGFGLNEPLQPVPRAFPRGLLIRADPA